MDEPWDPIFDEDYYEEEDYEVPQLEYFTLDSMPDEYMTPRELGTKALNLVKMHRAGLPVPPAVVLPTSTTKTIARGGTGLQLRALLVNEIIPYLEQATQKKFGDDLLVSVRSSGPVSMPGMMDTFLNVGINKSNLYRFKAPISMIETLVDVFFPDDQVDDLTFPASGQLVGSMLEVFKAHLEAIIDGESSIEEVSNWVPRWLSNLLQRILDFNGSRSNGFMEPIPVDLSFKMYTVTESIGSYPELNFAQTTLYRCIRKVIESIMNPEAVEYIRRNNIAPEDACTAVIIQAMVFGNGPGFSGTGVVFSRNPMTGEKELFGDWLPDAQGQALVQGQAEPLDISQCPIGLRSYCIAIEDILGDMADIEFTIENGKLWILQSRVGKRTPAAAFVIAKQLVEEGRMTLHEAKERLKKFGNPRDILNIETLDTSTPPVLKGTPASPGVATGIVAKTFTYADRIAGGMQETMTKYILVRPSTEPADYPWMVRSAGIVTEHGGKNSHAAVVARAEKIPAICGVNQLLATLNEGEVITIDGETGNIYRGELATKEKKRLIDAADNGEEWAQKHPFYQAYKFFTDD